MRIVRLGVQDQGPALGLTMIHVCQFGESVWESKIPRTRVLVFEWSPVTDHRLTD